MMRPYSAKPLTLITALAELVSKHSPANVPSDVLTHLRQTRDGFVLSRFADREVPAHAQQADRRRTATREMLTIAMWPEIEQLEESFSDWVLNCLTVDATILSDWAHIAERWTELLLEEPPPTYT